MKVTSLRKRILFRFCNPTREASVNRLPRRSACLIGPRHNAGQTFVPARGFTLIEVSVVLGIGMILSAMAAPLVQSSMASYQLQSAASSLVGVIQFTRYRAISQGYPFQVVFSHVAGTYQLTSSPNNDGTFGNVGVPVPFGNSLTTLGANATLQFSGGGSVKATAGSMTLVLARSGRTGTITVSNYGNVNVVYGP